MSFNPFIPFQDELDYKISLAQNIIIEEYMRTNGNIFISFSGGKDSTVLMHIAKRLFPDLKVVFSDTTNEMSEIKKYIKQFPDVITVKPRMPFKKVVKVHGFPLVSKEISQKANELKHSNGKRTLFLRYYGDKKGNSILPQKWRFLSEQKFDVTNKCCTILKKEPLEKWAKKNGNPKPLIALMSDESKLRQQLALYGNENGKKVYPFLRTGWTEKDIWAYAKKYNIRFAECYYDRIVNGVLIKALDRSGCEYCNFGVHLDKNDRFERSRALAPKRYENMMKLENNGITFKEAMNIVKNPISEILGLYGGEVKNIKIDEVNNKEVYEFNITAEVVECPCCSKKGAKTATKNYEYFTTFIDSPNPVTKRKRVIECNFSSWTCNRCGMTLENHLHFFDLKFNVTKRLIDYIYNNMDKKSEYDIINDTGLDYDRFIDIAYNNFREIMLNAYNNKKVSIWFDKNNKLIG